MLDEPALTTSTRMSVGYRVQVQAVISGGIIAVFPGVCPRL